MSKPLIGPTAGIAQSEYQKQSETYSKWRQLYEDLMHRNIVNGIAPPPVHTPSWLDDPAAAAATSKFKDPIMSKRKYELVQAENGWLILDGSPNDGVQRKMYVAMSLDEVPDVIRKYICIEELKK